jgi:hypothetical protein
MKKTVFRPIEPSDLAAAVHHLITLAVEYEAAHTKRHRHPETHAAASNYRRVWRGTKSEKMLVTVVQLARADQERRNQQRRAVLAAAQIPVVAARLKWLHGRRGGGHGSSTVEARATRDWIRDLFAKEAELELPPQVLEDILNARNTRRIYEDQGVLRRLDRIIGAQVTGAPKKAQGGMESLRLVLWGTRRKGAVERPGHARMLWWDESSRTELMLRYLLGVFEPRTSWEDRGQVVASWCKVRQRLITDPATGRVRVGRYRMPPFSDLHGRSRPKKSVKAPKGTSK